MPGWHIPQPQRRGFRGDVPLRHAQHFVTNHKFLIVAERSSGG